MDKKSLVRLDLSRQLRIFQEQALRTRKDLSVENVHRLRVTVRRIRAELWLIKQGAPKAIPSQVTHSFKKWGKILGKRREWDVVQECLHHYHLKKVEFREPRRIPVKKLARILHPNHWQSLRSQLDKVLQNSSDQVWDISPGLALLKRKIQRYLLKKEIRPKDLHQIRILIKKLRYLFDAMGHSMPELVDLQATLGKGHDLEVFEKICGRNKKIHVDQKKQYRKARKLVTPVLLLALAELNE